MIKRYQVLPATAPVPAPDDVLEMVVREGARKMLQAMLEVEIDEFLGRQRYQRTGEYRGYRNWLERYRGQTCYSSKTSVKYHGPQCLVSAGILRAIPWNECNEPINNESS